MPEPRSENYSLIVIGVSAGGTVALKKIIGSLPESFSIPIVIVQHISADFDSCLAAILDGISRLRVKEAEEQEKIEPGKVYLAPPGYHLLVEADSTLSFSVDPPVSYARPSVDVLFESAASAFGESLIGIILTGANKDGRNGLIHIARNGGLVIVQDPDDAEVDSMPRAALSAVKPDYVVRLDEISTLLVNLTGQA